MRKNKHRNNERPQQGGRRKPDSYNCLYEGAWMQQELTGTIGHMAKKKVFSFGRSPGSEVVISKTEWDRVFLCSMIFKSLLKDST